MEQGLFTDSEDPSGEFERQLRDFKNGESQASDLVAAWRQYAAPVAKRTNENLRPLLVQTSTRCDELDEIDIYNALYDRMRYEYATRYDTTIEEAERNMYDKQTMLNGSVGVAMNNIEIFRKKGLKLDVARSENWSRRPTHVKRANVNSDTALDDWFKKVPEDESLSKSIVLPEIQAWNSCASRLDLVIQALAGNEGGHSELPQLRLVRHYLSQVLFKLEEIIKYASELRHCFLPGEAPGRPGTEIRHRGIKERYEARYRRTRKKLLRAHRVPHYLLFALMRSPTL